MKEKIISNIFFSFIEKFFIISSQFFISMLLIRCLERQDYGIIGVVSGYFVFINILNISLESIILKDHKKYDKKLEKYIYNFFIFNLFKSFLFIILAIVLSYYLTNKFSNVEFVYSIFSITIIYIADALVSPLVIYNSVKFNQKLVTKISFVRTVLNILILLGIFYIPTLQFVFFKDLIVSIIYISLWLFATMKILDLRKIDPINDLDILFIKKSFFEYALWTHLNGVITNFIYKSDTFFLSMFAGLVTVGNYNIALNSANIANILPMILGYQTSIAVSNAKDRNQEFIISNMFIRLSIYIGIIILFLFFFFGDFYLYLMTGEYINKEIYFYMMMIVLGLVIVKSFASPLNAYINIKGSVYSLFKNVLMIVFIFTGIIYFFSAKYFGAYGLAISNVFISIFWFILIVREVKKYGYKFDTLLDIRNDYQFIKKVLKNDYFR